jgi:osmoprotectant transport system permease protein
MAELFSEIAEYFRTDSAEFFAKLLEHVGISLLSVCLAFAIAFPIALIFHKKKLAGLIWLNIFSTIRVIPSLAILFFCIIFFSPGMTPAVIALTALAVPPILINSLTAFSGVDSKLIEVGGGLGMSRARLFFTVKLMLASPFIIAGVKTATIEVIASATLASYIGGGGLGDIIFTGLGLMRNDLLIIGGLGTALLAMAADFAISRAEKKLSYSV